MTSIFRRPYFILLLFLSLSTNASFGQNEPRDFGDVPMEDLKSKICAFDSSASAVILFDVVRVNLGHYYSYKRHIRIKFFNNTEINQWASFRSKFVKQFSRISGIKGATYNLENGQIVATPLDKKNILERKVTKKIWEVSFALPQVRPGSIIEFSFTYTADVDLTFSNTLGTLFGVNLVDLKWQFQQEIPAYRCDFFFSGVFTSTFVQGSVPDNQIKEVIDAKTKATHWYLNNVPAFQEEPHSLPESDVIGIIYIDITDKTWNQLGITFNKLQKFGLTARDSVSIRQLGDKFKSISDTLSRVDSIITWVKKKIAWNGEVERSTDLQFSDIYSAGGGSSSEINLMIMALMKKAGLKSHPVLISTRGSGAISSIRPRPTQFDDVIVAVIVQNPASKLDEIRLIDGTDRELHNDYIPLRCLNGLGFLVDGNHSSLIQVTGPKSKTSVSANLNLSEDKKSITGELDLAYHGLNAKNERKSINFLGQEKYKQKIATVYPYIDGEPLISNITDASKPLKISCKLEVPDLAKFSNDRIYINPFQISRLDNNPFISETRISPVDLNPLQEHTYLIKVVLPKDYLVEELPKSTAFSLLQNSARFYYNVSQRDNTLFFTSQLTFNRVIFAPKEYQSLKEFYSLILSKQSEHIVLRKTN